MTFALFTRSDLVLSPGWKQIGDILLVIIGNAGLAFAMYGRCFENWRATVLAAILIALASLVTLFHPNDKLVWATGAITLIALIWAIRRHSLIASPPPIVETKEGTQAQLEDLAQMVGEAKRDIG
jgi:hypothetical protein